MNALQHAAAAGVITIILFCAAALFIAFCLATVLAALGSK